MIATPTGDVLRGTELFSVIADIAAEDRNAFVDRLLGFDDIPDDVELPRGAVPYLPCGVDEIVAMVRDVPLGRRDLLVDIGAGVGRVAILASLLSGARAYGIEIQDALVRCARDRCTALGVDGVTFELANAADVDLATGIDAAIDRVVVFLYAPCNGELLARVVRRIEALARSRSVVVCAVDLQLAGEAWLVRRPSDSYSLTIYDAR